MFSFAVKYSVADPHQQRCTARRQRHAHVRLTVFEKGELIRIKKRL